MVPSDLRSVLTQAGLMIESVLPPTAVAVEAFDDSAPAPLLPGEDTVIANAVGKRRQEFATARRCAREALAGLGYAPTPLLAGATREPIWPAGIVGSITHCPGYRGAAVARDADIASVGIDAEPHEPLPVGVLELIAVPQEITRLTELRRDDPTICWDRLLFSAKEAVYKAWFPLARRWLNFSEADIVFEPAANGFAATLLVPGPRHGDGALTGFRGRYAVGRGLVLTATAVPTRNHGPAEGSLAQPRDDIDRDGDDHRPVHIGQQRVPKSVRPHRG